MIHQERGELLSANEQWTSPANPLVLDVLHTYNEAKSEGADVHLFGTTGDLDNLGVYVARQGRARAEVLVDYYNQVIRNSIVKLADDPAITDVCFVPSGEEIFCLGVSTDRNATECMTGSIRPTVMEHMQTEGLIDIGPTAASFGSAIFGDEYDESIAKLTESVPRHTAPSNDVVRDIYFPMMIQMRDELSAQLDVAKFANIGDESLAPDIRRLVHAEMLRYKQSARVAVMAFASMIGSDHPKSLELAELLATCRPGIAEGDEYRIQELSTHLANRANRN